MSILDPSLRGAILAAKPSEWVQEKLAFHPDPKQVEFLESTALDLLIVWSRQTGKTETASGLISHFSTTYDETLSIVTSATQRQGTIVMSRIQHDIRKATGQLLEWQKGQEYEWIERDIFGVARIVRSSVMSLTLSNGSEVVAIPPSPDSARGYSPHLVLIDEAARTRDQLWHAVSPMRAARPVRLIAMTTASAMEGWFYDLWMNDPDVQRIEYLAKDCPRITPEFLAKERRRFPEMIYKAEYENVWFPRAGAALDPETVHDMFTSDIEPMFDAPSVSGGRPSFLSDEVDEL